MLIGQTPGPAAPPAGELIKDSDTANFVADVIETSQTTPVIVDFWAPWCGPCKTLGPILERLVKQYAGKIKMVKINVYHATLFAYYLDKLRATPDGDGTLLDHVTIIYGGGMSDSNAHDPHNLPILLVGGGGGRTGGRHLAHPKGTPLANLHLTVLETLGVPVKSIGDSTGEPLSV